MTWLKVKEAARLLDLTDSAIKKAIKINMNSAMSKELAGAVFKSKSPWSRCRRKYRTNTTTFKGNILIMT